MKKQLLTVKGEYVQGVFIPSHLYVNKKTAEHPANARHNLKTGWNVIARIDPPECSETKLCVQPVSGGYKECVSGKCIFVPIG